MADTVKTTISIDKVLFIEAEKTAANMKIARSKLYSIAIEKFLREKENEFILNEINANYLTGDPEDQKILEIAKGNRKKTVEKEEW